MLAAFGRAFGDLPENLGEPSKDQKQFLEQAVAGLAQEGKVISVRLALFAEMVKGKPWTPATLKEVGGTEGVGVTFLEETFSAATAPPEHRFHQKAARAVLKALLPESGTDIKGHMRSHAELLEASGYGSRPKDFDDLLRILDSEIRLITPTDPEGERKDAGDEAPASSGSSRRLQKYYQLTHDYLVPSLRDWLTRKQKETRRGRAELLLADRAAVWNARPENRQLPSLWQWFQIRWLTPKKNWTPPQRKMMRKASRYHAVRGAGRRPAAGCRHGHGLGDPRAGRGTAQGDRRPLGWCKPFSMRTRLKCRPSSARWPSIAAGSIRCCGRNTHKAATELPPATSRQPRPVAGGRHAGRLPLRSAARCRSRSEVPVIRDALAPHKDELLDKLWAVAETPDKGKESQRLRAAAALAKYDPDSQKWAKVQEAVVNDLVNVPAVYLAAWMDVAASGACATCWPRWPWCLREANRRDVERSLATDILADYAADQPQVLADLLMDADEKQFAVIYPKFKERGEQGLPVLIGEIDRKLPPDAVSDEAKEKLAKRQANAAVALLRMNQPEKVWPLLEAQPRSEGAELSDPSPESAGCRRRGHRQASGRGAGRDDSPGLAPEFGGV